MLLIVKLADLKKCLCICWLVSNMNNWQWKIQWNWYEDPDQKI